MATSRYAFIPRIDSEKLSTTDVSSRIYFATQRNLIVYNTTQLVAGTRLDHLAAQVYGDHTLWWIIAAASGIGWGLQCPPGTVINIPSDLNQIYSLLR